MRSLKRNLTLMILACALTFGIASVGTLTQSAAPSTSYVLYAPAKPPTGG